MGWGNNTYGQTNIPLGATNVAASAAGGFHNLALLTNGTVLVWGRNNLGQANVPVGLSNAVAVAAGGSHNIALRNDGSVAAWGDNSQGQITVPAGLTNVVGVAAGWYHSLALRSDGTVAAWGNNSYGQRNVPANLTNVVWIGAGLYHCLALRNDGTMVAWGYNALGQTTVPAGLSNVIAAAGGGSHNLTLRADGALLGWGYNLYGQATNSAGLSNIVSIAAGGTHSLAITSTSNSPPTLAPQNVLGYVNQYIVVTLQGTDADGDALTYAVGSLPARGALFQYAAGARGQHILSPGTIVTDISGRIIFAPVTNEFASPYTTAQFTVNDALVDSPLATITFNVILPPPPQLEGTASSWTNGVFQLVFSGATNAGYSVWASTNLVDWNLLGPAQMIRPGTFRFVDITTTNWPQRFYRAGAP